MERKNYLVEELSNEEKAYLKSIIENTRKKYLRDNYSYITNNIVSICELIPEEKSVLDTVLSKCEESIKSAVEFEKIISDNNMYKCIKALSLKEKMVLFSLYKEDKNINQIANEMNLSRKAIWSIKNKVLDKIMNSIIRGENKDV